MIQLAVRGRWSSLVILAGMIVLAACAGAVGGAAEGRVVPVAAGMSCAAGETGAAAVFCGARPGGPASAVCAMPGRTALMGFMGMGLYGVRLADSSIIEAKAAPDSAVMATVVQGVAKGVDPCGMRLLIVERQWRLSDSASARAMFDHASARLARLHAAPLIIRCGQTRGPRQTFQQMAVGGGIESHVSVMRDQTTDSAEVALQRDEDEYLKTLNVNDIVSPSAPPSVTDSAALRTRYRVRAMAQRAERNSLNAMSLAFAPVATGATACARMRAGIWK